MPSPNPQPVESSALPRLAFFGAGSEPPGSALVAALNGAGFRDIRGGGEFIFVLSITPPGGSEQQISPPGRDTKREFDVTSVITLIGGTIKGLGGGGADPKGAKSKNFD